MLEEDREGTDAMGQESMLAAPTEKEDQVAVAAKQTVDKATEKTAEARLEEGWRQQGRYGVRVPVRWRPGTRIPSEERREVKSRESRRSKRTEGRGRPAFSEDKGKSGRKALGRQATCGREDPPTNRHRGSRHRRKGILACPQKKKHSGKRSWTRNGKKKDERRVEEKKEGDDVGTREERGGQVRVGGQAKRSTSRQMVPRPRREGRKGVCWREDWGCCGGEESLASMTSHGRDGGWERDEEGNW